jgi:hypothetical protein
MNKAFMGLVFVLTMFAGGAMILVDQALMGDAEGSGASSANPILTTTEFAA